MMIRKLLWKSTAFFSLCLIYASAAAQTQIGNDIDGETTGDKSGSAVSMPDAFTVAIGAPNNDGNGGNSGQVRIYHWNGSDWTQKGQDLDGEAPGDLFGAALSMPDANTVAVGAPQNDGNGSVAGHVRIFSWNGSSWNQKGADIDGLAAADLCGAAISMPNPNTVAIGSSWSNLGGLYTGHTRIFDWNGNSWMQRGDRIDGVGLVDYSGGQVSMPDENTVAIAAKGYDPAGKPNAGHVRIFSWNGSAWTLKGNSIDGEAAGDYSGDSVSMPDANTIAIGALANDGFTYNAGHVRIFEWNGSDWSQKGADIDGAAQNDESGISVSMPNPNVIAIGATGNQGTGIFAGHVRIFSWNGSAWVQAGSDIDAEAAQDRAGHSVSMPDANTVAVGAIQNDGGGNEAGHVRIFGLNDLRLTNQPSNLQLTAYPNPTDGNLRIDLGQEFNEIKLRVSNVSGQLVYENNYFGTDSINLEVDYSTGVYFIEISSDSSTQVLKVVKK